MYIWILICPCFSDYLSDFLRWNCADCNHFSSRKRWLALTFSQKLHIFIPNDQCEADSGKGQRDHTNAFSHITRPSKLQGVTVEGTNAVVVLEFGTNLLAKIAFDENVRPVWAATNGVSIGPIPTNTVRVYCTRVLYHV